MFGARLSVSSRQDASTVFIGTFVLTLTVSRRLRRNSHTEKNTKRQRRHLGSQPNKHDKRQPLQNKNQVTCTQNQTNRAVLFLFIISNVKRNDVYKEQRKQTGTRDIQPILCANWKVTFVGFDESQAIYVKYDAFVG